MASNFHIQKPYLLATLPNPSGPPNVAGRCVAGEVFGQRPGSKKRKRSELAIGIDGDAVNLYDVPSSRLVTSYPIPPQYFFTCPPRSVRWKPSNSKQVFRYTYISTEEGVSSKRRVTLFKDVVGNSGDTTSTSTFQVLRQKHPIVYMATIPFSKPASAPAAQAGLGKTGLDLLAVSKDGSIMSLDGDTLAEKWVAPASSFLQDLKGPNLRVDLAQACLSTDVVAGMFNGKQDVFEIFPQKIEAEGFNPDALIMVTSDSKSPSHGLRQLHVLSTVPGDPGSQRHQQHVIPVASFTLPKAAAGAKGTPVFRLDVESGSLEELHNGTLKTYLFDQDVAKVAHTLTIPDTTSFIRLSDSSVLTTSPASLGVYSPAYRSLQASTEIDFDKESQNPSVANKLSDRWDLLTYFRKLEVAVALSGRCLVVVQLEAPRTRKRKRRVQGLLIDSIGRGLPQGIEKNKWQKAGHSASTLAEYLPGTLTTEYWKEWEREHARAEELFRANDLAGFETLLASKFQVELVSNEKLPNGTANGDHVEEKAQDLPSWQWPSSEAGFRRVDRRWVIYAMSKVFTSRSNSEDGFEGVKLSLQLPGTSIINYLVAAGHMSVPNLKSAFSEERDTDDIDAILGEQMPRLLAEIDPTLDLLVGYLTTTKLGAVGLLTSIRQIMVSLDLIHDPTKLSQKRVNAPPEEDGGGDEEAILMNLDRLEQDLEVTEHHLQGDVSMRERGLTVALGLLGSCPAGETVRAMQRLFRPEELLSLIHVLRLELVNGGWTTRYLDTAHLDGEGEMEPPPDGSIRLIADLLSRCIDSVGPAGWMTNGTILARGGDGNSDATDFMAALKLEVSAALEGIQEAVYLRGVLTEAVKYMTRRQAVAAAAPPPPPAAVQNMLAQRQSKPQVIRHTHTPMLPLGLKMKSRAPQEKVDAGGEVIQRSRRERGYLGSQRVGPYTLERIVL